MQDRFWLRFESGERSGETVPIPAAGLTVGRNPGHALRIADSSVSGSHAELRVGAGTVRVVDTGSTNGTRVAGERVEERELAHGDSVVFGTIRLSFLDGELDSAPAEDVEGVRRASTANLQRSGRRSALAIGVIAVAVAVGAVMAWRRLGPGAGSQGPPVRPVVAVAGNLLSAVSSFESAEGGDRGWTPSGEAPAALTPGRRWRRSGELGLGAELGAGEWALSASDVVAVPSGRAVRASVHVRGDEGGMARLGLRLLGADGGAGLTVWSDAADTGELSLVTAAPSGLDRVQMLLAAAAGGDAGVGFDDASLVPASVPAPAAEYAEYRLRSVGVPARVAYLVRVDDMVLGEISFGAAGAGPAGPPAAVGASLSFRAGDTGLVVTPSGAPAGAALRGRVPAAVAAAGVVTTGGEGYRSHAGAFEASAVESLLLTGGGGLVRLGLGGGAAVVATPAAGGGLALAISAPPSELELQLTFDDERTRAHNLAAEARDAERRGAVGEAIGRWNELLDSYPFDAASVREAEERRVRLVEAGLDAVREVEREVERARFFALAGLFASCRARALEVAVGYEGTEVEGAARTLVEAVERELELLSFGDSLDDVARLETILGVLREEGSDKLAEHVQHYLQAQLGDESSGRSPGADPGGPLHDSNGGDG